MEVLMRFEFLRIILIVATLSTSFNVDAGLWFRLPSPQEEVQEFGQDSVAELDPNQIRVLVWNQYKGKKNKWRREYERFSRNQDVMLLQEAMVDGDMDKIFRSSRSHRSIMATSFIYRRKNRATGVLTNSSVAPTSIFAQTSRGVEIVGSTPKMILFNTYPVRGKSEELLTVNIHALNSVTWQTLAVQILDALKVINEHRGPVIFGGDFNTWSKNKMDYVLRAMARAGLEEVRFAFEERKMKVFGRPLDHVFVRGVTVRDARVEKTNGADHQPLLLTLRVR